MVVAKGDISIRGGDAPSLTGAKPSQVVLYTIPFRKYMASDLSHSEIGPSAERLAGHK